MVCFSCAFPCPLVSPLQAPRSAAHRPVVPLWPFCLWPLLIMCVLLLFKNSSWRFALDLPDFYLQFYFSQEFLISTTQRLCITFGMVGRSVIFSFSVGLWSRKYPWFLLLLNCRDPHLILSLYSARVSCIFSASAWVLCKWGQRPIPFTAWDSFQSALASSL